MRECQSQARMLVTGGAGFIGSNLVEELVAREEPPRVVDNFLTGKRENLAGFADGIELIEGDLCDPSVAARTCDGIDVVFHVAALPCAPLSTERPLDTMRNSVVATVNLLGAAKDAGVRRFIYSSSSSIYGGEGPLPQREDATPHPKSPYAASKLSCETYVRTFAEAFDMDTVSLRYFNVFGPRQPVRSRYSAVVPAFISRMLCGERPVIYGDGLQSRDFTYVSNVVRANLLAAEREERFEGEVLNIAAGRRTSVVELVNLLNQVLGTSLEPVHEDERPGDVRSTLADISRAREMIGYVPEVDIKEGLRETVEHFRKLEAK